MGRLECRALEKKRGDFLLQGISFSVDAGYVVGVIGRNGAGKTTLLRLLSGSYRPDGGELSLQGISAGADRKAYQGQLAYVFSETPFPLLMTADECEKLYGAYYRGFDVGKYRRFLQYFRVPEQKQLRKLSKGQQIRQQLAFALSYPAELYLFDEPGANLDMKFREEFYRIIRELTGDGTKAVIYVSHLVEELEQIADYILWIQEGRQKYFGSLDDLKVSYQLIEISREELAKFPELPLVGAREKQMHQEVLVEAGPEALPDCFKEYSRYASLKEIMYYTLEK